MPIATGAAAVTPHFSSSMLLSCAASSSVSSLSTATSFCKSAISGKSSCNLAAQYYRLRVYLISGALALLGICIDNVDHLGHTGLEHAHKLRRRGVKQPDKLGAQGVERRQLGNRLDLSRRHEPAIQ